MIGQPPPARPVYVGAGRDAVFGFLHEPASRGASDTAVILCPPWGWDEVASYRSRRAWAEHLAATGCTTLRFDFPGTGDSAGDPTDPDLLGAWTGAVHNAVRWLRTTTGCRRVALVGLGVGGLAAGQAVAQGAPVDDLVLWATPTRGRTLIRELRAFASLQADRHDGGPETAPSPAPDWMEAGGFVLTNETLGALESLALDRGPSGQLRRALLLERDGIPVDPRLQQHLEAAGVGVTVAAGDGWAAMASEIERSEPPAAVFATVSAWLMQAARAAELVDAPVRTAAGDLELTVDGIAIRESTVSLDVNGVQLFGVLSEPSGIRQPDRCAVFLNAGAVRRIGPNRLWVEAARRSAARGIPAFRVDLEGIGDADGDGRVFADVRQFYRPEAGLQVRSIVDHLETRGLGRQVTLIGLCSGAYWAFRTAQLDDRVSAAILFNPRALLWDSHLRTRRQARTLRKARDPLTWGRLIRGDIPLRRIASVLRAGVRHAVWVATARTAKPMPALVAALDVLGERGTRIVLAFADDEELRTELDEEGLLERLDRWPNLQLALLPGADHTVRPIAAQDRVHQLLDAEIGRFPGAIRQPSDQNVDP